MGRELYVKVRRGLIQTTGPSPEIKEEDIVQEYIFVIIQNTD
jgi:hypothetical protein